MRTLIVGDIHGCYQEFQALLEKAALGPDDDVIALGDIVDRGPSSAAVLDYFQKHPRARSMMGNHERKHVRSHRGETRVALSQTITRRQMGSAQYLEALDFMDTLPRYLELPEAILVHGFFEPGVPLEQQKETVIVGTLSGERHLKQLYREPWYELYHGNKPIVVGHRDYLRTGQPFIFQDRVFAIDTGCCTGGALTGLVLPEFRIVSVPAAKDHWAESQERHAALRVLSAPDESLSWEELEQGLRCADSPLPAERRQRLEILLATAESRLVDLLNCITLENDRILAQLRRERAFEELPAADQGSLYAACIGRTPLARFLHEARKGKLSLEGLRSHFKKPCAVIRFVEKMRCEESALWGRGRTDVGSDDEST